MLVNFVQFVLNLVIAMSLLHVVSAKLIERDPNSALGKALAFIV